MFIPPLGGGGDTERLFRVGGTARRPDCLTRRLAMQPTNARSRVSAAPASRRRCILQFRGLNLPILVAYREYMTLECSHCGGDIESGLRGWFGVRRLCCRNMPLRARDEAIPGWRRRRPRLGQGRQVLIYATSAISPDLRSSSAVLRSQPGPMALSGQVPGTTARRQHLHHRRGRSVHFPGRRASPISSRRSDTASS